MNSPSMRDNPPARAAASEKPKTAEFSGWHVLAEFSGVDSGRCDDAAELERALRDALTASGITICAVVREKFQPQGVTVLALLAESHASIHTYPETGEMFIDVFTCGSIGERAQDAVRLLAGRLQPTQVVTQVIRRGRAAEG